MLHVPSALFFKLTPYRIFRSVIVEEFFSIAVKHSHLVDLVYGWSKTQIFPRTIAHISLKKRREVLRYLSLLEIHPPLRQNLMLGILYGAVFLNVGINQLVQISSVSPELFRIAVCLAARKYCRDYKRRMSKKTVLYRERARKLPYCDLFDINGCYTVTFPMTRRICECKHHVFSGSKAASSAERTLFPAKTRFFVLHARGVPGTESICV